MCFCANIADYAAYRRKKYGSVFIRALIATFYKRAGNSHVVQLGETVIYYKLLCTLNWKLPPHVLISVVMFDLELLSSAVFF